MKFIEMFSGIGGFRVGLEKSGWKCVWANDINKWACAVYRYHYGKEELIEGDIREVDPKDIPDFDLLTAGFPCQSFSIAGRRKGFQDTRGTLFYDIARVVQVKRPSLLLLENVRGLLSNCQGKTFATILRVLGDLGYWCEWQVLNSRYFGVPQNRERVFIIGHLRDRPTREVFPIFGESEENTTGEEGQVSTAIDSNYWKGPDKHGQRTLIHVHFSDVRKYSEYSPTLITATGGNTLPFVSCTVRVGGRSSLDRHSWDTILQESRIRRLTPVECERLQGFPDNWTKYGTLRDGRVVEISDTQRYTLLGNAVTTTVVEYLGKLLKDILT